MDRQKKYIEVLQRLAYICRHNKDNFHDAAERTKNLRLKDLFNNYAEQHSSFVQVLKEQIHSLGGDPDHEQGTPLTVLDDLWIKIRTSFIQTKDDDRSILQMVRSSEVAAMEAYDEELQGDILETDLKHFLAYQRIEISKALHEVERLYFEQFPPASNTFAK